MENVKKIKVKVAFGIVLLLLFSLITLGYDISWWTIDGGGDSSSGGTYTLSGTIGQPDTGRMTGGTYTLTGGFWSVDAQTTFAELWYLF